MTVSQRIAHVRELSSTAPEDGPVRKLFEQSVELFPLDGDNYVTFAEAYDKLLDGRAAERSDRMTRSRTQIKEHWVKHAKSQQRAHAEDRLVCTTTIVKETETGALAVAVTTAMADAVMKAALATWGAQVEAEAMQGLDAAVVRSATGWRNDAPPVPDESSDDEDELDAD